LEFNSFSYCRVLKIAEAILLQVTGFTADDIDAACTSQYNFAVFFIIHGLWSLIMPVLPCVGLVPVIYKQELTNLMATPEWIIHFF